ncbi:hypothetical protein MKEN_00114600 [Mycena kentingensis (nom. inval.)]|nr:hypothetical protein MKEN_00114600 [Mycena kentingensis (nom. inval.)]
MLLVCNRRSGHFASVTASTRVGRNHYMDLRCAQLLLAAFAVNPLPDAEALDALANITGIDGSDLRRWFVDRRDEVGGGRRDAKAPQEQQFQTCIPTKMLLVGQETRQRKRRSPNAMSLEQHEALLDVFKTCNHPRWDEYKAWAHERGIVKEVWLNWFGNQRQIAKREIPRKHTERISQAVLDILEDVYVKTGVPSREEYTKLRVETGLRLQRLKTWFSRRDSRRGDA